MLRADQPGRKRGGVMAERYVVKRLDGRWYVFDTTLNCGYAPCGGKQEAEEIAKDLNANGFSAALGDELRCWVEGE